MRARTKWQRRDNKQHRDKHGMLMHNKAAKTFAAVQEAAQNANKPIIPGKTRFLCGNAMMVVVKRDTKSKNKWVAGTEGENYTTVTFTEAYIQKYRTTDRDEKP